MKHFFREWVYFTNPEERQQAYDYLNLWKKFHLKRFPDLEQVGEDSWVENKDVFQLGVNTLGLKIAMQKKDARIQ